MKALLIDNRDIVISNDENKSEIDVTEIVLQGHLEILPGAAYDETNDKVWIHSKLFDKYTRVEGGRYYINVGWFDTVAYFKQSKDYGEYLAFVRRNAKNRPEYRKRNFHLVKPLNAGEVEEVSE